MANQTNPTRHLPPLSINRDEYADRLRELASIPGCERCEIPLARAITDIAQLIVQIDLLYTALRDERMRSANLEAAIRAALGAHRDGETDPLGYLRDEIACNAGAAYGT